MSTPPSPRRPLRSRFVAFAPDAVVLSLMLRFPSGGVFWVLRSGCALRVTYPPYRVSRSVCVKNMKRTIERTNERTNERTVHVDGPSVAV